MSKPISLAAASGSHGPENENYDTIEILGSSMPCSCGQGPDHCTLCRVHLQIYETSGEGDMALYAGQDPDAPRPHVSAAAAAQAQQELLTASLCRPEGILQGLHRGAVTYPWQEHGHFTCGADLSVNPFVVDTLACVPCIPKLPYRPESALHYTTWI